MSLDASAALVQRGDPDRFAAILAAPVAARARLLPIYAFNLEVARAPWASAQPLIAEMRLQFWRDTLASPTPRAHEVAAPLHALLSDTPALAPLLDRVVEARRQDIARAPFTPATFDSYIEETSATLLWAAALGLGAPPAAEAGFRALGWAAGLAAYLRAAATLAARGRPPLPDDRPDAIRALAETGLKRLSQARAARGGFGAGAPAALTGWMAAPLLKQARARPGRVTAGTLALSEFRGRGGLLWVAATGRF